MLRTRLWARWWRSLHTPVGSVVTLVLSLLLYVVVNIRGAEPFAMIDLRVYYEGARHVWDDTTLYTFGSSALGLPFTYPPFAAIAFSAVAWLPWVACRAVWELASIAAIWAICLSAQRLCSTGHAPRSPNQQRCNATLFTAAALWMEPVRCTLNFGQVNLFIVAALLGGLAATRNSWTAGLAVGLTAAVKLVPGITVVYFLLAGRIRSILVAGAAGAATLAVSLLLAPKVTVQFFTTTIFDAARTGNIDAVNNQSLRGALARILHHDNHAVWAIAVVITVAVGAAAAGTCLRRHDRLGAFLVIQLVGLLVSPISWNHHWVWVLPLVVWAEYGPLAQNRTINTLSALWQLAVASFAVSILTSHQTAVTTQPDPITLWAQALYPTLGALTILGVWAAHQNGDPMLPSGTDHRTDTPLASALADPIKR